MNNNAKGGFLPIILVMVISLAVAFYWDKVSWIKDSVNAVLNPTAGVLLNWNITIGMIVVVFVITIITTLIQKYATDQKALKELKDEQKLLQQEMKKVQNQPEKVAELSKKQMEAMPKMFKLNSRSMLFTGIPFILFYRWFYDYFTLIGDVKFFGFLNWFWCYFILLMIFSGLIRKWLKVA